MREKDIRAAIQKVRETLGSAPATVFWPLAAGAGIGVAASVLPAARRSKQTLRGEPPG